MRLRVQNASELPPLAWAATISRGGAVEVLVGDSVETSDLGFSEGVWAGSFSRSGPGSAYLLGSAGRVANGHMVFSCANHNLEKLAVVQADQRSYISNSIPLVLAVSGQRLDPRFRDYRNRFHSFIFGVGAGPTMVPLMGGANLGLHYCQDIFIDAAGSVATVRRNADPTEFASFIDYRNHLQSTVSQLIENATDPARHRAYVALAAVSSGYDSGAAAVIARDAGCQEAFTLNRRNRAGMQVDHGGATIMALGLTMHELDRDDYLVADPMVEPLFLSAGFGGEDLTMAGLRELGKGRLLVTGVHGDAVWSTGRTSGLTDLARADAAGASYAEFRLHIDMQHLPLPFIGATAVTSLRGISAAPEMAPWRVPGAYDRPIARRLLEEAGVARGQFARSKHGYIGKLQTVARPDGLSVSLSPKAEIEFQAFLAKVGTSRYRRRELIARPLRRLDRTGRRRQDRWGHLLRTSANALAPRLLGSPARASLNNRYDWTALLPVWAIGYLRDSFTRAIGPAPRADG